MFRMRVTVIDSMRQTYEYRDVDSLEVLSVPADVMTANGDVTYARIHQYCEDPIGKPMHRVYGIYRPILAVNFEYVEVKNVQDKQ